MAFLPQRYAVDFSIKILPIMPQNLSIMLALWLMLWHAYYA